MSFMSIFLPLCQLLNSKSNVTLLVACVPDSTCFHALLFGSQIIASLGKSNLSCGPAVSTIQFALMGKVFPKKGCLKVAGSDMIPQMCLL